MSLLTASLLPALVLIVLGASLLVSNSLVVSTFKAFPRSPFAAAIFWGAGSLWFLYTVWNLSTADLVVFDSTLPLVIIFAVVALAAVYYVPDFLAVRGVSVITLLAAWEILMGSFGEYEWLRIMKAGVIVAVVLAIYFGCVPYRARDLIQWLFTRVQRARALGAILLVYALLIVVFAFTH